MLEIKISYFELRTNFVDFPQKNMFDKGFSC